MGQHHYVARYFIHSLCISLWFWLEIKRKTHTHTPTRTHTHAHNTCVKTHSSSKSEQERQKHYEEETGVWVHPHRATAAILNCYRSWREGRKKRKIQQFSGLISFQLDTECVTLWLLWAEQCKAYSFVCVRTQSDFDTLYFPQTSVHNYSYTELLGIRRSG